MTRTELDEDTIARKNKRTITMLRRGRERKKEREQERES
jgi:hypothetical protein